MRSDTNNPWTGQNSFSQTIKLLSITGLTQCLHVDSTGTVSGVGFDCGSGGGGGGATFQVNGTNTLSQTTINFINSTSFNGLTATFTNPSVGQVQLGFSGSLGVAGGGTGLTSVAGADYALLSSGANTWIASQINGGASCGDSTHGLSYTAGSGFGCQSITGSAAAGGSTTQLQYNNATALGGISGWTTNGTTTLTASSTGIFDMSSDTATNAFLLPKKAGLTVSGIAIGYDTTAKNYHIYANAADAIALAIPSAPSSGNLFDSVVSSGNVLAHDSGISTASVVTAGSNFVSANLVQAAGSNKTTSDSGIPTANVVTMSAAFSGAGKIPKSGGANKTLADGYSVQGTDTALMTSGTISGGAGTAVCLDSLSGLTTASCLTPTVNPAAQYSFPYYSASGTASTFSGGAPPTTNGFYVFGYNVTSGSAVAPAATLMGVPVNAQSGNYALLYSDRATYVKESGTTTATLTLPQITGNTASNNTFVTQNLNSGNETLTANAADKIDGSSTGGSATLLPNFAAFVYQDQSSAPGNWWTLNIPTFSAFGSTCGDSTHAMAWSTTAGWSCQTITATAAAGGSDGQVQINNSTALAGYAGFLFDKTSVITLGVAGTSVGGVGFKNATSGTVTLQPVTGALGTVTASLPANTGTIAETNFAQTWSALQTFGTNISIGGVTATGAQGMGKVVFDGSPTLTTPTIGVATATSVNKVAITAPATSATLTILNGKTLTANNSLTLAGTDSTTMTFPSTSATIARTDAANTFTGHQTIEGVTSTGATGTGNLVFSAAPTFTGTTTVATLAATTINGAALSGTFTGAPTLSGNVAFTGTPTFSNALALGSSTATTQSAGDNSTKLATTAFTNTEYTLVQTSGSPYTLLGLSGYYWNDASGAYTFQLDAPVAGKQYCFGNYSGQTGAITVKSTTLVYIVYKGANGTVTTGTLVSGGAAGDFVCMVGVDTTHYMVTGAGFGAWTNN